MLSPVARSIVSSPRHRGAKNEVLSSDWLTWTSLIKWPPKKQFFIRNSSGLHFYPTSCGVIWNQRRVKNTSKPIFKYPKCSNANKRIFESSLASDFVFAIRGQIWGSVWMSNAYIHECLLIRPIQTSCYDFKSSHFCHLCCLLDHGWSSELADNNEGSV